MKKWTIIVLGFVLVMMVASLALFSSEADSTGAADVTPTVFVYLPIVKREPTPTPIPQCNLYVENRTGGQLCYKVKDTGIGKKCFSSGTHYYGSFPPGTYSWSASSSRCGSANGSQHYYSGSQYLGFRCSYGAPSQSMSALLQSK